MPQQASRLPSACRRREAKRMPARGDRGPRRRLTRAGGHFTSSSCHSAGSIISDSLRSGRRCRARRTSPAASASASSPCARRCASWRRTAHPASAQPSRPSSPIRAPALKPAFDFRTFGDVAAFTRNARLVVAAIERSDLRWRAPSSACRRASMSTSCGACSSRREAGGADHNLLPAGIGSRLSRAAFDDALIFRTVEKHLGIRMAAAQVTVRAETADAALARGLAYDEGAPCSRWRCASARPKASRSS